MSPTIIDFGNVDVGTTSATIAAVVTNTSASPFGPLNLFGGAPPSAEFNAFQDCQGTILPPGGTCRISYTFTPSATGPFTDTSVFVISPTSAQADGVEFTVTLMGCGVESGGACSSGPAPTP